MIKFTAWSPSRLRDYEQCPLMAKLKYLDKLCPICFKGKVAGDPSICDTCGGKVTASAAMERGSVIDAAMEAYLKGETKTAPPEIVSPISQKIALAVRKQVKEAKARVQLSVTLDRDWRPTTMFSGSAWLRTKMDVLVFQPKAVAHVIDWKTGGINKKTGEPWDDPKYDDQLSIYTTTALSAFQAFAKATAALVFLDAARNPLVEREGATLTRDALEKAQARWNKKLIPMMNDDVFAPCASNKCGYCDFSKKQGGPCQF